MVYKKTQLMESVDESSTPINWKSEIDEIVDGYETEPAKGLVHGLQKDAIQNGWGHRKNKKGNKWRFVFELTESKGKQLLIFYDEGTTGLTGPNLSTYDINNRSDALPPDYKLARFTSMKYSGGNEGAGLYGRGKLLFQAASKEYSIYFDTLTEQEGYRANWRKLKVRDLRVGTKAKEGKEAKDFLKKEVGIEPLKKVGTRVIIVSPRDEIVKAIKNGEFLECIEETWWKIIEKGAIICVKYNGKQKTAKVPPDYANIPVNNQNGWKVWFKKNIEPRAKYRMKKLHFLISPQEINEELRGVYLYRKDMKVGCIELDIPPKIKKHFFGYIELDKYWEEEAENIEDLQHYGFKNKRLTAYQLLKETVNSEFEEFMEELGLKKKRHSEDEVLRKDFEEISREISEMLSRLDIEALGEGRKMEPILVRWAGAEFPSNNSVVTTGDEVKNIRFKIKNNLGTAQKISCALTIMHNENILDTLEEASLLIPPSEEIAFGPYNFTVKQPPLIRYEKLHIALMVKRQSSKGVINKKIVFYYDCMPAPRPEMGLSINIIDMNFPRENSSRVNTNEIITNIKYIIRNRTSETAYIGINIRTHNMESHMREVIQTLYKNRDIIIPPFSEEIINCPDIEFKKEIYESHLSKGIIELRASLSASKRFLKYELGDIIANAPRIKIYFNKNYDGEDVFSLFNSNSEPDNPRRSYIEDSSGGRRFILNISNPCYLRVKDDEYQRHSYLAEEILKQTICAYIKDSNFSVFEKEKSWFTGDDFNLVEMYNEMHLALDKLLAARYGG